MSAQNLMPTLSCVPYSGKFSKGENFCRLLKIQFLQKKISWIARFCRAKRRLPPKFAKYPLYDIKSYMI